MEFLSEDPTFLAGGLGLVALAFLIALRVTQQGKYLIRAAIALALALGVVVVERLWVTDNERIEQVVYDLRRAVVNSDAEGVIQHLAPDVQFNPGGQTLSGDATRQYVRSALGMTKFEFVRLSHLEVSAGGQTRRGSASFRVFARGQLQSPSWSTTVGTADSDWSLGFQETSPQVWKVNRITPSRVPPSLLVAPGMRRNALADRPPPRQLLYPPYGRMRRFGLLPRPRPSAGAAARTEPDPAPRPRLEPAPSQPPPRPN
jgi:ketosteroid isomerase-like protein